MVISSAVSTLALWLDKSHRLSSTAFFPFVAFLHSLYSLQCLIQRPPNLFSRLAIPLNLPVIKIRELLLFEAGFGRSGGNDQELALSVLMPSDLELLLSRLKVDASREWFVRFGQRALQTCVQCTSASDYSLFVLSGAMLAYVYTAVVLLLLTSCANGRHRWRGYLLPVLVGAAFAEGYAVVSASAGPLPQDGMRVFMWHDNIRFARHVLCLLLPLLTQFLPVSQQPAPPSASLARTLAHLERSLPRAQLLKYTRAAVMRQPELRESALRWWAREKRQGDTIREDANVQKAAEKMGLGFAEAKGKDSGGEQGKLRMTARMAVESLKGLCATPVGP